MSEDTYTIKDKISSGRRFLVLVAGLVFLFFGFSVALCVALYIQNKEAMVVLAAMFGHLMTVIVVVYNKFFEKDRQNGNG